MPGIDALDDGEFTKFAKSASFKSHKLLPRRKVDLNNESAFWGRQAAGRNTVAQRTLKDDITTWAPEPSRLQMDPDIRLPLTPPHTTTEEPVPSTGARCDSSTIPGRPGEKSGLSTPVSQRSPPTPESTPPRRQAQEDNLLSSRVVGHPSSRTESFKTAREDFSSDDEGESHPPSTSTSSREKQIQTSLLNQVETVGLGLGLESEDEDRTPTVQTPRGVPDGWEFNAFDGAWSHHADTVEEDPVVASQPVPMVDIHTSNLLRRQDQTPFIQPSTPTTPETDKNHMPSRNLSLRERLKANGNSPESVSLESFAKHIQWPMTAGEENRMDVGLQQVDDRRFSQMSGTSTVVEAFLIETPPQRRQTLRHTSKRTSLRSADSPDSGSNLNSLTSNEKRHKLVHRNNQIADRTNRSSQTFDSNNGANLDHAAIQSQPAPSVAVPQRRSSLKSSATHSRRHSRIPSGFSEHKQSSRPTTAPDLSTGYFELSDRQARTLSDSYGSPVVSKLTNLRLRELPPIQLTGSSSISVPTSKDVSRDSSVTPTSLRGRHSEQIPASGLSVPQIKPVIESESPQHEPDQTKPDHEDALGIRPRSTLMTPFSMTSMQSSTPGDLEVSEATAVNIYSHNNKSVLVVQQLPRRATEIADLPVILAESAQFDMIAPLVAPALREPRRLVDSPLKHPREPPQPPGFVIIPPTPAYMTPTVEAAQWPEPNTSNEPRPTRFAKVRRALSARRYSESLTRSLSSRYTMVGRRLTVGSRPENRLSPFWRPRAFWNDLSDSESDFGNDEDFTATRPAAVPLPPSEKVSRTSSLTRRLGSLNLGRQFRPKKDQALTRRYSNDSIHSYKILQTVNMGFMPRLGNLHFVGLQGLQDRLEKKRIQKYEERRERERNRLRRSIGPVVVLADAHVY
ncbi:hypothetical protein MMC19_006012 [Ptychographa xylographoides]|nr:hypothetical protein [Ptychographa xylographoides]